MPPKSALHGPATQSDFFDLNWHPEDPERGWSYQIFGQGGNDGVFELPWDEDEVFVRMQSEHARADDTASDGPSGSDPGSQGELGRVEMIGPRVTFDPFEAGWHASAENDLKQRHDFTQSATGGRGDDSVTSIQGVQMVGSGAGPVYGDSGDNAIVMAGDDDTVYAQEGNDSILGNGGADNLWGQEGDDYINGGDQNDKVEGGDGDDTILGENGADTLYGRSDDDVINGGEGDDSLNGGADDDTLFGGDGEDTIIGGSGHDSIVGGDGDDIIASGSGNDTIEGGDGDDHIDGFTGTHLIYGGDGDDTISGAEGNDTLYGDKGNDSIEGSLGNDSIGGGVGNDSLVGGEGADTLKGGSGHDTVDGGDGNDVMRGGRGNDLLIGGAGENEIHTGKGQDIVAWQGDVVGFNDIADFNLDHDILQFGPGFLKVSETKGTTLDDLTQLLTVGRDTFMAAETQAAGWQWIAVFRDVDADDLQARIEDLSIVGVEPGPGAPGGWSPEEEEPFGGLPPMLADEFLF